MTEVIYTEAANAELMENHGADLRILHSRAMGKGLFELRCKGQEGIGRVFYCTLVGREIVILPSFIKKSQETPDIEMKIARKRLKIFADLGFDAQQSQNLLLRSQTMIALAHWFKESGLTQAEAAKTLGVTQPRFNQLLKGKIEIFSLDALVNMATNAGMRVGLNIRPVSSVRVRGSATAKKSSSSTMAACPTVGYQKSL